MQINMIPAMRISRFTMILPCKSDLTFANSIIFKVKLVSFS